MKPLCDQDEAMRIIAKLPDLIDQEKLAWYIGTLQGQIIMLETRCRQ